MALSQVVNAQNFTEVMGTPFVGVTNGAISFADVDGDNDQDILITGDQVLGGPEGLTAKLYMNDGTGNFTEVMGTPFTEVMASAVAFADIDGDNDKDVLITGGFGGLVYPTTGLYTNDGLGNYTQMAGTPFDDLVDGSIAFADVDGDNDQDVLITGVDPMINYIAKLYTNDGLGNFTEVTGTPFAGVQESSISFADVDGDNDQDVLITGLNLVEPGMPGDRISKLYMNDGAGNFTEVLGTPFDGVELGSIAFADVDGDNDQDVLITGRNDAGYSSKLYTNDGSGNFTEVMGTPFAGVQESSIAFADVDGDSDLDVHISGIEVSTPVYVPMSRLYLNDGTGNFTEVIDSPFEGVRDSSIAFADVDGDNDQDALITGSNASGFPISKLYLNNAGALSSSDDLFIDANQDLTLFPNPATSSNVNVRFSSTGSHTIAIRVYDFRGQLIREQLENVGTGEQTLVVDIAGLSSGGYFIHLEHGEMLGVARFTVQK